MTCIIEGFKSKKELKAHLLAGGECVIQDPSIVNPRWFQTKDLKENEEIVATNHPKRSWFAQIGRKGGKLYVK